MAEPTNGTGWRLTSLERRVELLEQQNVTQIEMQIELREVKRKVEELVRHEESRELQEHDRQVQAVRDRKADRRWQLTVMAAWASAIIAAIAIIVPLLVG